jgi:hypothetical protein
MEEFEQFDHISNDKNNIISELEEFGFNKEIIEKELAKSSDIDIISLISNRIEYKEKMKELRR